MTTDVHNVITPGSGPAGYAAALYTARASLNPLVRKRLLPAQPRLQCAWRLAR